MRFSYILDCNIRYISKPQNEAYFSMLRENSRICYMLSYSDNGSAYASPPENLGQKPKIAINREGANNRQRKGLAHGGA
jgi:hypothetical protein